ncbi:MAG: DUF4878 domain-containing protein [Bacteroidaceae bacterium]|nr:DUF4878 domain-containing protein [Bacteroidaceae bacterium]
MKKVLSILSLALVALAFVSCSKDTPEAVVEQYVAALQAGQYEEALDLFHFKKDLTDQEKQQYVSLMREKWSKELDQKGGIEGCEITNVETASDGNSAVVNYVVKYSDGSTKSSDARLLKIDGKWKMDAGK